MCVSDVTRIIRASYSRSAHSSSSYDLFGGGVRLLRIIRLHLLLLRCIRVTRVMFYYRYACCPSYYDSSSSSGSSSCCYDI